MNFPRHHQTVNVTVKADYGSNVLGIPDNLYFAKVLTIIWQPNFKRFSFTAALRTIAYRMIQVDPNDLVHSFQNRNQNGHPPSEWRRRNQLDEIQARKVP